MQAEPAAMKDSRAFEPRPKRTLLSENMFLNENTFLSENAFLNENGAELLIEDSRTSRAP
jgi:hypothetical protein